MCIDWNTILPVIITAILGIAGLYFQDRQARYSKAAAMLNAYMITQQKITNIINELLEKVITISKKHMKIQEIAGEIALRGNRPDNNTWIQLTTELPEIIKTLSKVNPILTNLQETIKSIDPNHTTLPEIEEIKQKITKIKQQLTEITKMDSNNPEEVKQIHKPISELFTIIYNLINIISNLQIRPPHQTILLKALKQLT